MDGLEAGWIGGWVGDWVDGWMDGRTLLVSFFIAFVFLHPVSFVLLLFH
jgi:hypothetical protein